MPPEKDDQVCCTKVSVMDGLLSDGMTGLGIGWMVGGWDLLQIQEDAAQHQRKMTVCCDLGYAICGLWVRDLDLGVMAG
jgi:hypothetical protein